jgi:GNAT superfamily N-acetyltransferase
MFRPYEAGDRDAIIGLLLSNVPRFFAAGEEDDLAATLDAPDGPHVVYVEDGRILAYGGFEIGAVYNRVTLAWGMVHAEAQGRGLGRRLLAHRAALAAETAPPTDWLAVDTTPAAAGFYERCGFERVEVWPRGYRAGFDMVVLRLRFGSPAFAALTAAGG